MGKTGNVENNIRPESNLIKSMYKKIVKNPRRIQHKVVILLLFYKIYFRIMESYYSGNK